MTLPNFLVIGAQRAGTTLLHRMLAAHPEVFVPDRRKEIHYFDRHVARGPAWYQKFFPSPDDAQRYRAIGEVTPDYMFAPEVPRRIHDLVPDCRLLVSLRNPVERAYSAYLYAVRSYHEKRPFEAFLRANPETLERGRYSAQLVRYFELFPKDAVLVLVYEELVADPAGQLARIAGFLGLARCWDDPVALLRERVNASEIPRFRAAFARARRLGALLTHHDLDWVVTLAKRAGVPRLFGRQGAAGALPEPILRRLETFYLDEVAALEALLGRDLRRWWGDFAAAASAPPPVPAVTG